MMKCCIFSLYAILLFQVINWRNPKANKIEIFDYLKNNIWHEVTEHKAVYNMAEMAQI